MIFNMVGGGGGKSSGAFSWGKYNVSNIPVVVGEYTAIEYIEFPDSLNGFYGFGTLTPSTLFVSASITFALNDCESLTRGNYFFYGSNEMLSGYVDSGNLIIDVDGVEVLNTPIDNNKHTLTLNLNNILLDGVEVATDIGLSDILTDSETSLTKMYLMDIGSNIPQGKYYAVTIETTSGTYDYLPYKNSEGIGYFYSPNSDTSPLSNLIDASDNEGSPVEFNLGSELIENIKEDLIEYIVDDSENAYPDGAVHTDGYWYERAAVVNTEGMYCWEKKEVIITYPEITGSGVTITQTSNVYSVTTSSSSGWANHKLMTPTISLGDGESVDIYHIVGATGHTYQMGFTASTPTAYSDHVIAFKIDGSTMYQVTGSTNVASYGTCAAGDVIHLELKDGTLSVYRNDAILFSASLSLSEYVFSAWFYGASKNGGSYEIVVNTAPTLGYVLSDNINTYPYDDYHTDGYYYKLLENNIPYDESVEQYRNKILNTAY